MKSNSDLPWGDQQVRVASFDLQDTKILTQAEFDALPVRVLKDVEGFCDAVPVGAAWKVHVPEPAPVWMYCEKVGEDGFVARWIRIQGAVQ